MLDSHYRNRPELERAPYEAQWQALMELSFGTADAYSHNLTELGHPATEVVPNCRPLQLAWAGENRPALAALPWRLAAPAILLAQVGSFAADVVYVQSIGAFHPSILRLLRRRGRLLAGQIASEVPEQSRLSEYGLILTSFPHYLDRLGVDTELLRIGFDERVLARLGTPPSHEVVFVGQLGRSQHRRGNELLEAAAHRLPVDVWGPGEQEWLPSSPFRTRHHGTAWGLEMYRVLAGAKIALNRHLDGADGHANNMRLFEATGVGSLLLTDEQSDLADLFFPGREVVSYTTADDLADKARWYLEHEDERAAIAAAGQARTLADHTYRVRMRELVAILERYAA